MMSPNALDDLLDDRHHGDRAEAAMSEGALTSAVQLQEPITCGGCGGRVQDRFFLLAAARAWHSSCLRCCVCLCHLQSHASLFWRDGAPYCQEHYLRFFGGGLCARCLQQIPASDLVMKSGDLTFHQHCFCCQECEVRLVPGSLYCLQGQSLFCRPQCGSSVAPSAAENLHPGTSSEGPAFTEGEESESSSECRLVDSVAEGRVHRRAKRIRTCFRSEQIRALESYFAQKQNPDGKDWTALSQRTGLSKRVLQVWFQNARARLRRSVTSDDLSPAPCAHLGPVSTTTSSVAPPSPPFSTSTIDQSQLSLLTAPLSPAPCAHYDSHDAPGHLSPAPCAHYDSHDAPGPLSPAPCAHYDSHDAPGPLSPAPCAHYDSHDAPGPLSPASCVHFNSHDAPGSLSSAPRPDYDSHDAPGPGLQLIGQFHTNALF